MGVRARCVHGLQHAKASIFSNDHDAAQRQLSAARIAHDPTPTDMLRSNFKLGFDQCYHASERL